MRLRVLVVVVTVCSAVALAVFFLALWLLPRISDQVF
jgi:phage shock protein PspC (stress-responsive transcriptional regulator)